MITRYCSHAGILVAVNAWQIYLACKQGKQPKTNQQETSSKVYVANWKGVTSPPFDNLVVYLYGCTGDDHIYGARVKPRHYVILETWIALTFVNSGSVPNAIIRIEPIYENDFARAHRLPMWHITMHKSFGSDERVGLAELPPSLKELYFRAIRVIRHQSQYFLHLLCQF